jgi:predicted nucleic acid-binding Zn ribbon protein
MLVSDKRISKGLHESVIKQEWSNIMGTVIAKHTTGMYLKGSELHLYFNSSIIKNEFLYNKEKAISIINEALGQNVVSDIVIR